MRACAHTRSRSRPRQLPVNSILVGDALINAIGRLLETNDGQAFCRLCLVRVLQADHHNVSKALTVLRLNPYYGLDARTCSVCHQPRVTIRLRQQGEEAAGVLDRYSPPPSPDHHQDDSAHEGQTP
jgi:hypothetical protein